MNDALGSVPERRISRRRLLRLGSGLIGAGAAASLLSACAPSAPPAPTAAPAKPPAAASPAVASPAASPVVAASPSPAASPGAQVAQPAPAAPATTAQAGPAPVAKTGSRLSILQWSHFVPKFDEWIASWSRDWGQQNGVTVTIDHVRNADLPARIAAEASAGVGHDLIQFQAVIQSQLYVDKLVDMDDVAAIVGNKYGGWLDLARNVGLVGGTWKALTQYFITQPNLYRKDYFDQVGVPYPDDYPTLIESSKKLKAAGYPCGMPLSNCNDGNHNWRSFLYSYGGKEVEADGKTLALNSPQTLEALRAGAELFNGGMTDEVFSWDDAGNNRFLISGRASWVHNASSAYFTMRDQNPEGFANLKIALQPRGPVGRFNVVDPNAYAIWKFSPNVDTAKAWLVALFDAWRESGEVSGGYNNPPLVDHWRKPMVGLSDDPNLAVLQDWRDISYVYGFQGVATTAAEEVLSTFVIPNMFARAARGETPEAAMAWGVEEQRRIYSKYTL